MSTQQAYNNIRKMLEILEDKSDRKIELETHSDGSVWARYPDTGEVVLYEFGGVYDFESSLRTILMSKFGYTIDGLMSLLPEEHALGESDKTPILYFDRAVFRDGLNLTVRRGTKWHTTKNRMALLRDLNDVEYGYVHYDTVVMTFNSIPQMLLELEHDPAARNYQHLLGEMCEIYEGFHEEEIVTLVFFMYRNWTK